jgi:hypothetical protein
MTEAGGPDLTFYIDQRPLAVYGRVVDDNRALTVEALEGGLYV